MLLLLLLRHLQLLLELLGLQLQEVGDCCCVSGCIGWLLLLTLLRFELQQFLLMHLHHA